MGWRSTNKKNLVIAIKAMVAICVLALLVRRITWHDLLHATRHAHLAWITLAFVLLIPNLYCQLWRWRLIVQRLHPQVKIGDLLHSLFAGITLGFITPGRIGDLGRTIFIPGADWLALVGLMLVEKWYALLVVYFFGLIGLIPFLQTAFRPELWVPVELTGLVLVTLGISLVLHPAFLSYLLKRFDRAPQRRRLHQLLVGIRRLTPSLSRALLLLTLLQVSIYFLQFYFLIKAFTPLALLPGLSAVAAVMWSKTMLPISLGDLGIRESAAVYFLGKLQVPSAAAFDSALLLFGMNVLLPALIGFVFLLQSRILQTSNE